MEETIGGNAREKERTNFKGRQREREGESEAGNL
jgi:hypothetical protein